MGQVLGAHLLQNFGMLRGNVAADHLSILDAEEFGSFRHRRVGFVVKHEVVADIKSGVAVAAEDATVARLVPQQALAHARIAVPPSQQVEDRRNNVHVAAGCVEPFPPASPVPLQDRTVKDKRDVDSLKVVGAEGNAGVIAGEYDQGMLEIRQAVAQLCEESLQARIDVMKGVELALAKWSWKTFRDRPG